MATTPGLLDAFTSSFQRRPPASAMTSTPVSDGLT